MWQAYASRVGPMHDSLGRKVEVIYPGRLVRLPGPDLLDAIVSLDDGPARRIAIEMHLDEASWFAHGHHRDAAFDAVQLHVVWNRAGRLRRALPPSLDASRWFADLPAPDGSPTGAVPAVFLCRGAAASHAALDPGIRATVVRQGLLRHAERSDALEGDITALGEDQALYRALMRGLGFRANTQPFTELAACAPVSLLEQVAGGPDVGRAPRLEAVLLGAAGLLPSQRGEAPRARYVGDLEAHWRELGRGACLRFDAWSRRSVRPLNWPTRRVAAAARLFMAVHGEGRTLSESVVAAVLRAADTGKLEELVRRFRVTVAADDFWARHYDFGRAAARPAPTLIGRARGLELLVNGVLPFAAAVGRRRGHGELARASTDILVGLGAGGWNQHTRYMAEVLAVERRGLGAAAAQQGMLRLYQRWCRDKRCDRCPAAAVASRAGALTAPR